MYIHLCVYMCIFIHIYIYVPQICFPFPFFSVLLPTKLAQVFDLFFVTLCKESSWNKFFINQDFRICKATYDSKNQRKRKSFTLENLFCTIMLDHGLIIKAIILTLQWNYTTGLRYVNLLVYLDFNKARLT